jgi:hypothetical protein
MASSKLREPPKKKAKFLKPDQIHDFILDSDNEESKHDDKPVDDDDDYE